MNNIFFVTSGIYTKQTIMSIEDRILQTIDTAKSIREKVDNVKIYLLEGGEKPLSFKERERFLEIYDDVLDFTEYEVIKLAQAIQGATMKSACESYMMMMSTKLLSVPVDSRIFKICGRYLLSDKFDLKKHHDAKGKYLFKNKDPGLQFLIDQFSLQTSLYRYETRFYSVCGSIFDNAVQNFHNIFYGLAQIYANNLYNDLEHMTYMMINPDLIEDTNNIGVQGLRGEEGVFIDE